MPSTIIKTYGSFSSAKLLLRLAPLFFVSLLSFSIFRKETLTKATATTSAKIPKILCHAIPIATTRGRMYGAAFEPILLMNCAKVRFLENIPGAETVLIIGLPTTCRAVMPTPIKNMGIKTYSYRAILITGISSPTSTRLKKRTRTNFCPFLSARMPSGTEKSPNAKKPKNGRSPATAGERLNSFVTKPTRVPTASPNPIIKKTRNIGMVLGFMACVSL